LSHYFAPKNGGYCAIILERIKYRVKADAPKEKLLELCNYVQRTSPVLDIVRNPVPVSMEMVA
jgi:hypothetical protein